MRDLKKILQDEPSLSQEEESGNQVIKIKRLTKRHCMYLHRDVGERVAELLSYLSPDNKSKLVVYMEKFMSSEEEKNKLDRTSTLVLAKALLEEKRLVGVSVGSQGGLSGVPVGSQWGLSGVSGV